MCDCDCEYPEFFIDRWVKARKPHQCGECRRLIKVGSTYYRATGKWDGEVSSFVQCERCSNVRHALQRVPDCCIPFGSVREYLRYHTDDRKRHRQWIRKNPPRVLEALSLREAKEKAR